MHSAVMADMKMRTATTMIKTYSKTLTYKNFRDRYLYLQLSGKIGFETFGSDRYLNQMLYRSTEWKQTRYRVIVRDCGKDLAHEDYPISGRVIVHHIEPITKEDILDRHPKVFDLENLISVSHYTHEAIHFGSEELLPKGFVTRRPNDTCPWR